MVVPSLIPRFRLLLSVSGGRLERVDDELETRLELVTTLELEIRSIQTSNRIYPSFRSFLMIFGDLQTHRLFSKVNPLLQTSALGTELERTAELVGMNELETIDEETTDDELGIKTQVLLTS